MKIKFKKLEILAVIFICIVIVSMCFVVIFYDLTLITFKALIVKIVVMGIAFIFIFHLYAYFRHFIKSLNNIAALEIDDLGISNNISRHKFLNWSQISHFSLKTVQMSSGRHSKIYVHTYDPEFNEDQY